MSDTDWKNKDENPYSSVASSSPNFHIYIKGAPFHLRKEILAKKSAKVSLLLEGNKMDELSWILRDLEADPDTFELVARFCYGYQDKFSSDNVLSLLCIAYYLGMNEEMSSNNLVRKASEFLEQRVFPSWNETVIALRSGDKFLDKLKDVGLVDLFFDTLIEKASYDPRLLGETVNDREETNDYRPNPRRRLFVIDWKSEDVNTLPLRLYEPLMIRAMNSRSIPVEYIVSSVSKYAEKWVFDEEESVPGQKREAIEAVERLLPHQRRLLSCKLLFELLKQSIRLEASSECRNGIEIRISRQLDMAKSTDLKALSRGYGEKSESFEDTELVKTVIMSFYANYANEEADDVTRFGKIAKMMEEFLFLAASEASLKLEVFLALAEITVAISLGVLRYSDGIYRAIDVFLESHRYLTEYEKMEACKVLDCSKLSPQECEQAAKNQKLPLRVVVQVLFVSQLRIRDTVAKEIQGMEEKEDEDEETGVWSDENEMEKMNKTLLELKIENRECVVHGCKKAKAKEKNKMSVWREVKRKFGCLASSSSLDDCSCDLENKKKKMHHHYK